MKKPIIVVIGNGFDLNLHLETKYSQFLNTLEKTNSLLIEHLKVLEDEATRSNKADKSWINIEKELENLAVNSKSKIVNNEGTITSRKILDRKSYESLKSELKNYLKNQKLSKQETIINTSAYILFNRLFNSNSSDIVVLNFNYTNTLCDLLKLIYKNAGGQNFAENVNAVFNGRYHFIHGSIDSEIVFGIDDKADIGDEYIYLLKAYSRHTSNININKMLYECSEIYFFGYSLGETDASYFEDFFQKQCKYNVSNIDERKKIVFFYYEQDGYDKLIARLHHLTNKNLSKLNQYNTLNFFDYSNVEWTNNFQQ